VSRWPSVGVVIPTYERPAQLTQALASVLAQDYPGRLEVVVVFDRTAAEESLAEPGRVRVLANNRTPGLAGARNTGILAAQTELVAFCDDDDQWLAGKLTAQVRALQARPGAEFASCSIRVRFNGALTPRLAGQDEVAYHDLVSSRLVMVHSSTYLASRPALLNGIGLVDESIPGSQNEDWDLALRAARRHPIVHVDQPLVDVTWGAGSHYSRQWQAKADSLLWMLEHHHDIAADRAGAARVYAQVGFAYACMGKRSQAYRWAGRCVRRNWHDRRLPFVLAVASGAVSGERVLAFLHSRGHGI
jgi:glycosyltransferase involved in cell wall biosynthesis